MNSKVTKDDDNYTTIQTERNGGSVLHTEESGTDHRQALIDDNMTSQQEEREKSNMWILLAMLGGLFYALGNVAFGISCSQLGIYGAGIPAPISLLLVLIYRGVEACAIKRRTGHFIDKASSNYWKVRQVDDEYQSS